VVIGIHDGLGGVGPGEVLGASLTVDMVIGTAVDSEMRLFMDDGPGLGICSGSVEISSDLDHIN
jgi:hypothetical protein